MNTLEIEIALMEYFGVRQNLIVPNVYYGIGLKYECDLIKLTPSNYATEIEIKTSKSDMLKDKLKNHNHDSNLFKYLYFAVPENLKEIALKEIPYRSGIFVVRKSIRNGCIETDVEKVRTAERNTRAIKWSVEKRYKLAELGAMRILDFKKTLRDYLNDKI